MVENREAFTRVSIGGEGGRVQVCPIMTHLNHSHYSTRECGSGRVLIVPEAANGLSFVSAVWHQMGWLLLASGREPPCPASPTTQVGKFSRLFDHWISFDVADLEAQRRIG